MLTKLIFRLCILFLGLGVLPVEELILPFHQEACAQIRRRKPRSSSKKKPTTKKKTTTDTSTDAAQLELRNRELLKQIVDLQNERDFYKKKLLEWSEAQKKGLAAPGEQQQPQQVATLPALIPQQKQMARIDTVYIKAKPETIVVRLKPDYSYEDSLLDVALTRLKRKDYHKAGALFQQLLESPGCQDRHFYHAGLFSYKIADFETAIYRLDQVVRQDSLLLLAAYFKGRSFQMMQNYPAARIEFNRCAKFKSGQKLFMLGNVYENIHLKLKQKAKNLINNLPELSGELAAERWVALANIYLEESDIDKAMEALQSAVTEDSYNLNYLYSLGKVSFRQGYYQTAFMLLDEVRKFSAQKYPVNDVIAKARYYLSDWDGSLQEFLNLDDSEQNRLLKKEWIPKIYYIKSLIAGENSKYNDATTFFRRALIWDPDASRWMEEALHDLGRIYETNAENTAAIKTYSELIRINSRNPEAFLKMGILYFKSGDLEGASLALKKASRFETTRDQASHWLSIINNAEGPFTK